MRGPSASDLEENLHNKIITGDPMTAELTTRLTGKQQFNLSMYSEQFR